MSRVGLWNGRGEEVYCHAEGHGKTCLKLIPCTGVRSGREGTEVTRKWPFSCGAGPWTGVGVVAGSGMACELAAVVDADTQRSGISHSFPVCLSVCLSLSVSLSLSFSLGDLRRRGGRALPASPTCLPLPWPLLSPAALSALWAWVQPLRPRAHAPPATARA